jgi:hypothetical protein
MEMGNMSDLSAIEAELARQAQDRERFQSDMRARLLPPVRDTRTPSQVMSDGYRDSAAEREAEREGGEAA